MPGFTTERGVGAFLRVMSTSMGTRLPGVGLTCAGIMEDHGADEGRERSKLGIQWTDQKALLEALF